MGHWATCVFAVAALLTWCGIGYAVEKDSAMFSMGMNRDNVGLTAIDLVVIFGYLVGIVLLGSWAG